MAMGKRREGFTLVELMMVVSLIAILTAIAVPRMSALIQKSNEGASKAKLGAVRSALTIYYADMEGQYPGDLSVFASPGNKYLRGEMSLYTAQHGSKDAVQNLAAPDYSSDAGSWGYVNEGGQWGTFWVQCTHMDGGGKAWTSY